MRYDKDEEYQNQDRPRNQGRSEPRYGQFGYGSDRSFRQERNYEFGSGRGEKRTERDRGLERDPFPTQNRNSDTYGTGDYRYYGGERGYGMFDDDRRLARDDGPYYSADAYYSGPSSPRTSREHRGAWEAVKDFFGIGPKGYTRSDERIREDVSDALTRDRLVDASQIEVEVSAGTVTLQGSVGDKWMKRQAEDCAEEVAGVRHVKNELEIQLKDSGLDVNTASKLGKGMETGAVGSASKSRQTGRRLT